MKAIYIILNFVVFVLDDYQYVRLQEKLKNSKKSINLGLSFFIFSRFSEKFPLKFKKRVIKFVFLQGESKQDLQLYPYIKDLTIDLPKFCPF